MRIAIILSGLVRHYDITYYNIFRHIINCNPQHKFDIFISTWDIQGLWKGGEKKYTTGEKNTETDYILYDKYDINDLIEKYKPVDYKIHNQAKFRNEVWPNVRGFADRIGTEEYNRIFGCIFSQFYSLQNGLYLVVKHEKKHDFKYDFILRTRFDLILQEKININHAICSINISSHPLIYTINSKTNAGICMNHRFIEPEDRCAVLLKRGYNDAFAFSKRGPMIKYCFLYRSINKYLNTGLTINQYGRKIIYPEFVLSYYMINLEKIYFIIDDKYTAILYKK
jgi:hypothetical protein